MKTIKTMMLPILTLCVSIALFAFINNSETAKAGGSSAAPLFKALIIKHTVADYEKWKPAYTGDQPTRKEYGLTDIDLLRGIDNPSQVLIAEKIADVQKAKDFTALPALKELMNKAGVIGAPEFAYYDVIRDDDSKIAAQDRVIITHRVKDFDAWLKAYDGEGKATRAKEGLVDRVLCRSIDDPNIVQLVFAVTDMAKAKTSLNSEAKKKLMTTAGVEGAPVIEFFKQAK